MWDTVNAQMIDDTVYNSHEDVMSAARERWPMGEDYDGEWRVKWRSETKVIFE